MTMRWTFREVRKTLRSSISLSMYTSATTKHASEHWAYFWMRERYAATLMGGQEDDSKSAPADGLNL